ncbi:MAG TPA: hypothetical protein VF450_18305 [Noviherbaspirillum sp.]
MAKTTTVKALRVAAWAAAIWIGCVGFALVLGLLNDNVLHCRIDEASAYPCVVLGFDIGLPLAVMGNVGLIAAFGFPLFLLTILFSLLVAAVSFAFGRSRK